MSDPTPTVEQLVEECQALVRSLAMRIHRKLPAHIELDDLIAYGQVGLVEAARDFDPSRGNRFSTYAYYRIRGAVYDGLAKMTWFSRAASNHVRYEQISNEVLRVTGEAGLASEERKEETDLRWLRDVTRSLAVVYLSTHVNTDEETEQISLVDRATPPASTAAIDREIAERLHELIDALPAEAGELIRATYFDGLTLQEAGRKIGVSKSWASRLHAKTLQHLARSLRLQGAAL